MLSHSIRVRLKTRTKSEHGVILAFPLKTGHGALGIGLMIWLGSGSGVSKVGKVGG